MDQEDPWRTGWLPTPVSLPGESHGQSSLLLGCPGGATGKELACQSKSHERRLFDPCKDPLEAGTATHSSILAWKTPWTEEAGGLQSIGSQRGRCELKQLSMQCEPRVAECDNRQYLVGIPLESVIPSASARGLLHVLPKKRDP